MKKNKILLLVIGAVVLYALSAGASYLIFSKTLKKPISISTPFGNLTDATSGVDNGVRNQQCPLNGVMYTQDRKDAWLKHRPLAVMVENSVDARPQLGLSRADVIYEAVAEGGITRFMALYYCQDAGDIAPIRSARTYFIDWLSEYNAAYSHVGGANTPGPANALGQIQDYGIMDLDQFGLGFPTYWRGTDKLAPHNVHSTTEKLWAAAAQRGYGPNDKNGKPWIDNFIQWNFKDEAPLASRGDQKPITVPFWPDATDYTVNWQYDKQNNVYKRYQDKALEVDPLTNEPLSPKNIVIQFETEKMAGDGYPDGHLLYGTIGSGKALFFQDGKITQGKWIKTSRTARSKYVDSQGNEIKFNRGLIWIQTIPLENSVTY